jgi:hypothetical protein
MGMGPMFKKIPPMEIAIDIVKHIWGNVLFQFYVSRCHLFFGHCCALGFILESIAYFFLKLVMSSMLRP